MVLEEELDEAAAILAERFGLVPQQMRHRPQVEPGLVGAAD